MKAMQARPASTAMWSRAVIAAFTLRWRLGFTCRLPSANVRLTARTTPFHPFIELFCIGEYPLSACRITLALLRLPKQ
jgi:hypothetical protein